MVIIFVYDTELLQREEDDPASAILYFHPGWVSDVQRTALCGQLMGTTRFLKSTFAAPRIVALQSGKFVIQEYGRYTLAVGTDRNIADWVLEYRSETLSSLINFYHRDLQTLGEIYNNTESLSAKLYHAFEVYLKILLQGGSMFANIPTIQLPNSGSSVFLESLQVLQYCQEFDHVLGGITLYHNKVVSTQLSAESTRRIVLADPFRIKSPAEVPVVDFTVPHGVQLLYVYIDRAEHMQLWEQCRLHRCSNTDIKETDQLKTQPTKEPVLSAMKRDQSIIFTAVPEDVEVDGMILSVAEVAAAVSRPKKSRPKFLNLKSKTIDLESHPIEPPITPLVYKGTTSICSTPMTELNKVLHTSVLSICCDPEPDNMANTKPTTEGDSGKTNSQNSILSVISQTSLDTKLKQLDNKVYFTFNGLLEGRLRRCVSTQDVKNVNCKQLRSASVGDPTFTAVKLNGSAISRGLYTDYCALDVDISEFASDKDTINTTITDKVSTVASANSAPNKSNNMPPPAARPTTLAGITDNHTAASNKAMRRRSLNLPLKSLSFDAGTAGSSSIQGNGATLLTPLMSKLSMLASASGDERSSGFCSRATTPSGYQAPAQLHIEHKCVPESVSNSVVNSDHCGHLGHTHAEVMQRVVLFVCGQQDMVVGLILAEEALKSRDTIVSLKDVCMEQLCGLEKHVVHCLEACPNFAATSGKKPSSADEPYSFLRIDDDARTLQRGGPWGAAELGAVTHLVRDFKDSNGFLTEIILRDDDAVVYGNRSGGSQTVFYHQSMSAGASWAGLPPPADLMGLVPLKAKRRLERDQGVMLF